MVAVRVPCVSRRLIGSCAIWILAEAPRFIDWAGFRRAKLSRAAFDSPVSRTDWKRRRGKETDAGVGHLMYVSVSGQR